MQLLKPKLVVSGGEMDCRFADEPLTNLPPTYCVFDFDNIIAMDETPVYHDMLAGTTLSEKGAKSVVLKTTGHYKYRITLVLTAKTNGEKCKSCVVFPATLLC